MSARNARAMWTPTNWDRFCTQAVNDANREYRRQLISQATDEDLVAMYRVLMTKRDEPGIEDQLRDIDRERVLRTAT